MTLWKYIKERMLSFGGSTVREGGVCVSYDELVGYIERFALRISGQGCCAVCCASELSAATAILGCIAAGVPVAPLSMRYGTAQCRSILDVLSPTCVVTDADGSLGVYGICDSSFSPARVRPALIMFTSGTTGTPKGAMLTESAVMANVSAVESYLRVDRRDTMLISRPLYHCAALTDELLVALVKGCGIVFSCGRFDPVGILGLIRSRSVSFMGSTPTVLGLLARMSRGPLPLRGISVSGECLSRPVAEKIRKAFPEADIYHAYGLTEACTRVSFLPCGEFDSDPCSVGYALPGVSLKILDPAGRPVRSGVYGELWVKGKNIMRGYYARPDLTRSVLQGGWLRTGDIAAQRGGKLYIRGRADDMIIRAGINIFPQEIEAALRRDPRTADVVAYGFDDGVGGVKIGLKICGSFTDEGEVRRMCVDLLPSYEVPSKISLADTIDRGVSGKLVRLQSSL